MPAGGGGGVAAGGAAPAAAGGSAEAAPKEEKKEEPEEESDDDMGFGLFDQKMQKESAYFIKKKIVKITYILSVFILIHIGTTFDEKCNLQIKS